MQEFTGIHILQVANGWVVTKSGGECDPPFVMIATHGQLIEVVGALVGTYEQQQARRRKDTPCPS